MSDHSFLISSSSLSSGMHRYAGDVNQLKLRLSFTNHGLLSARPSLPVDKTKERDEKGGGVNKGGAQLGYHSSFMLTKIEEKWIIKTEVDRLLMEQSGLEVRVVSEPASRSSCNSCKSRYRNSRNWSERDNNLMERPRGGPHQDTQRDDLGRPIDLTTTTTTTTTTTATTTTTSTTNNNQHSPTNGTSGIELTKSKRAFNWKDTATVTSDNNNWQRTLARKLPYEMRNHHRQDYHHHHRNLDKNLSCGSCASRDYGKEIIEESYDELTDWYQEWLLNRERNLAFSRRNSVSSGRLGSGADESDANQDYGGVDGTVDATVGGIRVTTTDNKGSTNGISTATVEHRQRAPVSNLGANVLDHHYKLKPMIKSGALLIADELADALATGSGSSRSNKNVVVVDDVANNDVGCKDADVVSDATSRVRGEEIIISEINNKQWSQQTMTNTRLTAVAAATGPRCSHGEILYIMLVKHEINGIDDGGISGESFVAQKSGGIEHFGASGDTSGTTRTSSSQVVGRAATDATVGHTTTTTEMDKRDDEDNKKVQKLHQSAPPSDSVGHDESSRGDDKQQQQLSADDGTAIVITSTTNTKATTMTTTTKTTTTSSAFECQADLMAILGSRSSSGGGGGESNDKERQKINQTSDRQQLGSIWMQQEQLRRQPALKQRCWLNTDDSKVVVCLAVIVIDVLNRFIQLKPDLNKLISVDICTSSKLGFFVSGARCSNSNTATTNTNNNTNNSSTRDDDHHHRNLGNQENFRQALSAQQSQLLYQLELADSGGGPAYATNHGRSEAIRELNLVYNHLLAKSYGDSRAISGAFAGGGVINNHGGGGFLSPMNGSVLIKLQFDIHFASDFSKDCRNLYVKYKLLARRNKGSKWSLRRLRVKEESINLATKTNTTTSSVDSSNTPPPLATSGGGFQQQQKRDEKQKLAQMTHLVARQKNAINTTAAGGADDKSEKPSAKSTVQSGDGDRHQQQKNDDHDTCLLEGSTITSRPDSNGRFHFACVEQLLLESRADSDDLRQDVGVDNKRQRDKILMKTMTTTGGKSHEGYEKGRGVVFAGGIGVPDESSANNNNNSSTTIPSAGRGNNLDQNLDQEPNHVKRDDECEIVLLLELYSSDFYRDKLQGWSHLSIPVCLDRETTTTTNAINGHAMLAGGNSRCCACRQFSDVGCNCTERHELPVIRPELCSSLDKLRYYLIGQLPKSTPSIESFVRSNHRYLLLTKQSGKLVLDCEIARQFSDPNFDTALRDLLEVAKQKQGKRNHHYNGVDLIHTTDLSGGSGAFTDRADRELDTKGAVEAYQRAKHRIDKLNINSFLMTDYT